MFTLELPNDEAQKLIRTWENNGILNDECALIQQDGYVHINWLYGLFHYDKSTFDLILSILCKFLRTTYAPFIVESQEITNSVGMYSNSYQFSCVKSQDPFEYCEFRWPEQIERYRVALLLKATE